MVGFTAENLARKRPADKNAIFKIGFWAWLIWPWKPKGQKNFLRTLAALALLLWHNPLHWPLTCHGQISLAKNAILEITFFFAGLFRDISCSVMTRSSCILLTHQPQHVYRLIVSWLLIARLAQFAFVQYFAHSIHNDSNHPKKLPICFIDVILAFDMLWIMWFFSRAIFVI